MISIPSERHPATASLDEASSRCGFVVRHFIGTARRNKEVQPSAPNHRYAHSGRSLPLDMLRGIAILLVLGRHFVAPPVGLGPLQPFAEAWTAIGWSGVDLFFVLSGFLVSGLLFAEYRETNTVDTRRFIIRRGFKIWPSYIAYLGFVSLWLGWQFHQGRDDAWGDLWANFLHVQNYFGTPRVHTWSLALEEHFYLAIALLFAWLVGRRRGFIHWLPTAIIAGILGEAILRHVMCVLEGANHINLYATHLRFDGLLVGTLIAYYTHFYPTELAAFTRRPLLLLAGGVLLAAPTLTLTPEASPWSAGLGLTAVYVGFGLILLGWINLRNSHAIWGWLFSSRPAAWLGQIGFYSYSIYLWHVDLAQTPIRKVAQFAQQAHVPSGVVWVAATIVYVVAAIFAGRLLSRALESPSLALRERLFPSRTKTPRADESLEPQTVGAGDTETQSPFLPMRAVRTIARMFGVATGG
jgi:peptidoglycan/LPS O-acetylase OafA/YrhL